VSRISIVSNRFEGSRALIRPAAAIARNLASSRSMLSAAEFAAIRMGTVCTIPMHTPTTNISAVVTCVMAPPFVSLKLGTTNTTVASNRYIALCENTNCL